MHFGKGISISSRPIQLTWPKLQPALRRLRLLQCGRSAVYAPVCSSSSSSSRGAVYPLPRPAFTGDCTEPPTSCCTLHTAAPHRVHTATAHQAKQCRERVAHIEKVLQHTAERKCTAITLHPTHISSILLFIAAMFIYVLLRLVYLICIAPFLSSRRFLQSCQTARSGCPRCILIYTTPCSTYRILECSIGLYTKHTPPTEALYVHFNFQTFNVVDFNVVDHLCSSSIILDFSCTGVDTALGYDFPGVFCNALSLHCI